MHKYVRSYRFVSKLYLKRYTFDVFGTYIQKMPPTIPQELVRGRLHSRAEAGVCTHVLDSLEERPPIEAPYLAIWAALSTLG